MIKFKLTLEVLKVSGLNQKGEKISEEDTSHVPQVIAPMLQSMQSKGKGKKQFKSGSQGILAFLFISTSHQTLEHVEDNAHEAKLKPWLDVAPCIVHVH